MNFHHVALSVKNLEDSIVFYKEHFGFVEVKRFVRPDLGGHAVFLGLGPAHLELWQFDRQKRNQDDSSDLNTLGYKHIALQVPDLESIYTQLKAKGLEITEPKQGAVAKHCFVKDPDGLPVELLELPEDL